MYNHWKARLIHCSTLYIYPDTLSISDILDPLLAIPEMTPQTNQVDLCSRTPLGNIPPDSTSQVFTL